MTMHIGFDVSQTGPKKAGCGYYAHALATTLPRVGRGNRFTFYPDFGDFFFDARMPLRNPYPAPGARYGRRHLLRGTAAAYWNSDALESALGHPDIVHANNFWCPLQLQSARVVYTLYDLAFISEPAWTTEANRVGCFRGVFRAAMAADWIVAISAATRDAFLATFPHFPAGRVRVIHPWSRFGDAAVADARPAGLGGVEVGGFWLCAGTIEPRKNQRMLARAYAMYLARGGRPMPLVFAGGEGWCMDDFPALLAELGIAGSTVLTGYVTDAELVWLYRNCHANLYPSLLEGFGFPVLEGMQFGAPTLCSSSSSMPEVAGSAGWLLDPHDEDAWCEAMLRLARHPDLRAELSARGRERALAFDPHQGAARVLTLYEEAIDSPKRRAGCGAR